MSLAFDIAKRIHFDQGVPTEGGSAYRVSRPAVKIAIAGIAIGVAVMLLTVGIVVGFKQEIRQKVIGFGGHLQVQALVNNQTYELPPICVSDSLLDVITHIEGVTSVEPFITKPSVIKSETDFLSVVVKGVERVRSGELGVRSDLLEEREVLLSRYIADKLQLGVGDEVPFYFVQTDRDADVFALGAENTKVKVRKLTVRDIYETHFSEIDQQMVIAHKSLLQQVSGWDEDMVSGLSLDIDDFDRLEDRHFDVIDHLAGTIDREGTPFYVQTVEQLNPAIFSWLALLDTNVWVILILIAVVAAFTMISGLLIIILERTQMIGILKAQGLDNRRLRHVFLWVALFLTGQGMLWGNVIGLALCFAQNKWHFVALDPTNYYLEWVPIHLTLPMILLINLGTILVTLLVLLGPSSLVARISPAKAITSE